jgi:hypothetical protein
MKRQRGHMNESNLDTLAVTCTVHQEEIAGEWSATLPQSDKGRVARNPGIISRGTANRLERRSLRGLEALEGGAGKRL